ncbi:MAG: DnaD domain protein [Butyricicoccus sp.]
MRDTPKSTGKKDKPMTSVLLPEGELRVARCDMLDKLIAVGDGDAALLYLYILRHGGTDGSAAARALRLSADRYERAAFTLNNLIAPTEKTKAATDKSAEAPRYTGDEPRRARLDDQTFSGLCDAAEGITGRALTEGQLRCLLTIYDYLGLDAGATIELLSYLKSEKGTVRTTDLRREANQWADMGIVTAQAAQQYLTRRADEKPLSEAIYRALGADTEQPAPKEQRVCRWHWRGFPADAVELAVHRTGLQGHKVRLRSAFCADGTMRAYIRSAKSPLSNRKPARLPCLRARRRRSDTRTADRQRHTRRLGADWAARAQSSPQHGGITYGIR